MEVPGRASERAFRHHRQHAGAGGRLQHHVVRPDGRCPKRRVGEGQWSRELLQADLFFGTLRVGGFQGGHGLQHLQHGEGSVRTGPGVAAHGTAMTADEQHDRGLGGLVGVLPDPGALGVACAEGACHGVAQSGGVERPAGLQDREEGCSRGKQRVAGGRTEIRGS